MRASFGQHTHAPYVSGKAIWASLLRYSTYAMKSRRTEADRTRIARGMRPETDIYARARRMAGVSTFSGLVRSGSVQYACTVRACTRLPRPALALVLRNIRLRASSSAPLARPAHDLQFP